MRSRTRVTWLAASQAPVRSYTVEREHRLVRIAKQCRAAPAQPSGFCFPMLFIVVALGVLHEISLLVIVTRRDPVAFFVVISFAFLALGPFLPLTNTLTPFFFLSITLFFISPCIPNYFS